MWGNYDKRGKWKRRVVSIDEIVYANGEEGTLNAYMWVQGREKAKKLVIGCFPTKWMNSITVSLKGIPESLILKIHNIVGIYASKFFVVNIENCSPITMFMKGKALRFLLCFRGFMWKLGLHYLFLIWAIWFVCIMVHTMHIPMFSLLAFQRIFIVFCLLVNCKQTYLFDCWLILCKYFLQLNALN